MIPYDTKEDQGESTPGDPETGINGFRNLMIFVTAMLLAAKLGESPDMPWWLVTMPLWIGPVALVVGIVAMYLLTMGLVVLIGLHKYFSR